MHNIRLTEDDIDYLNSFQPGLKYIDSNNIIHGVLSFNKYYENDNGEVLDTITDGYEIEINLNKLTEEILPDVRETAGRILNIASKLNIKIEDLHCGQNGKLCIIISPLIKRHYPKGFNLIQYIEHLQNHFYWISYYEKYQKAPWKAYRHGKEGYFQLFLENKKNRAAILRDFRKKHILITSLFANY